MYSGAHTYSLLCVHGADCESLMNRGDGGSGSGDCDSEDDTGGGGTRLVEVVVFVP